MRGKGDSVSITYMLSHLGQRSACLGLVWTAHIFSIYTSRPRSMLVPNSEGQPLLLSPVLVKETKRGSAVCPSWCLGEQVTRPVLPLSVLGPAPSVLPSERSVCPSHTSPGALVAVSTVPELKDM